MVARGTQLADPPPALAASERERTSVDKPFEKAFAVADEKLVAAPDVSRAPKLTGVIAEYGSEAELHAACERVRDAGMTRWDSFTPYPVHGIEKSMGIKPTILPWLSLGGGLTGAATGILMQWYMNGSEELANAVGIPTFLQGYNFLISGKPIWSVPANIPVAFELTILFSAFGAFFGMLLLNRLPRWSNPRLRSAGFRRGTDDGFTIGLDAADPKFDLDAAAELLAPTRPSAVREVWDVEPRRPPAWIPTVALILFALLLIPPVLIAEHRNMPWETPRIHPVGDMDWQAKFKPQERNPFFADGRAMRPQVEGTIARGQLDLDDALWRGTMTPAGPAVAGRTEGGPAAPGGVKERRIAAAALFAFAGYRQDEPAGAGDAPEPGANPSAATGSQSTDAPPVAPAAGAQDDGVDYTTDLPIEASLANVRRGQLQFNIYCAPCHGVGGFGNGLVHLRADQLKQPTWLPPSNLHEQVTRTRPNGFIYDAITNGVRKMPAYGSQIDLEDRWNVVLYVRALQKSQHEALEAIPAADRDRVLTEKAEAQRKAAEEKAAEEARAAEAAAAESAKKGPSVPGIPSKSEGLDKANEPAVDPRPVPRGKTEPAPESSSSAAPSGSSE